MKNTPAEKCAAIIAHYGIENQLVKLCEECGELIVEACKAKSMGGFLHSDFIKELADVKILLTQFEIIISRERSAQEIYDETLNFKLDRQLERIKHERTE